MNSDSWDILCSLIRTMRALGIVSEERYSLSELYSYIVAVKPDSFDWLTESAIIEELGRDG